MEFLKQILNGQKQFLKTADVESIKVPQFREMNATLIYEQVIKN